MNRLFARPTTGQAHRIGTQLPAPVAGNRTPLIIPDAVPVVRWPLAVLTVMLTLAGTALIADKLSRAGTATPPPPRWTADTRPIPLTIADHPMSVPANLIADAGQRSGGDKARLDLARLDLAVRWPSLSGYDETHAPLFQDGEKSLIRIWLEKYGATSAAAQEPVSEHDGTLRREIYPVAGGLFARAFVDASAYEGEEIVYEATALRQGSETPFAARCQKWNVSEATCLRRVELAPGLTMTYRFPRDRLADWGRLDRALTRLTKGFLIPAPAAGKGPARPRPE